MILRFDPGKEAFARSVVRARVLEERGFGRGVGGGWGGGEGVGAAGGAKRGEEGWGEGGRRGRGWGWGAVAFCAVTFWAFRGDYWLVQGASPKC